MGGGRLEVRTSIPGLQDKIQMNLDSTSDTLYWYIKFNTQLDEDSVSGKTMNVTDTDGYIMRTIISYKPKKHVICVSPLDTYEEGRYYLLNISRRVRSATGQNLRSTIHILFKLVEDNISDFKVLDKGAKVPDPKPRPDDYDFMPRNATPNHFERQYIDRSPKGKMATDSAFVNPALLILGFIIVGVSAAISNMYGTIGGITLAVAGIIHILYQLRDEVLRSKFMFNKGVRAFNRGRYKSAEHSFLRAFEINPDNELAKHGVRKAKIYYGKI
ncbi:MAG: tetratricopeptide repeat protein [Firmicutes bacterium]|nr:tetratricopeptide repeat protein [Bacillota bacterium]